VTFVRPPFAFVTCRKKIDEQPDVKTSVQIKIGPRIFLIVLFMMLKEYLDEYQHR